MAVDASIVVLTWDGAGVLPRTLPRILAVARADAGDHEVIVVDNGSTDDTAAVLAPFGSAIRVVRLEGNRGVAGGFNAGLRASTRAFMVTLPNDIMIDEGFLETLLDPFAVPDVFAVSGKRVSVAGGVLHACLRYDFDAHGLFNIILPGLEHEDGDRISGRTVTWYAPWVNAAWRCDVLRAMGGFEEGFGGALSWWAEADPSYRAWKRGWRVLYEPRSVAWHLDAQTGWKGFASEEQVFWFHEGLLFLAWTNLTDRGMLERHLNRLPALVGASEPWIPPYLDVARLLLQEPIDADFVSARVAELPPSPAPPMPTWQWAFASMVKKLPQVIRRRQADRRHERWTDAEVFRLVNG